MPVPVESVRSRPSPCRPGHGNRFGRHANVAGCRRLRTPGPSHRSGKKAPRTIHRGTRQDCHRLEDRSSTGWKTALEIDDPDIGAALPGFVRTRDGDARPVGRERRVLICAQCSHCPTWQTARWSTTRTICARGMRPSNVQSSLFMEKTALNADALDSTLVVAPASFRLTRRPLWVTRYRSTVRRARTSSPLTSVRRVHGRARGGGSSRCVGGTSTSMFGC